MVYLFYCIYLFYILLILRGKNFSNVDKKIIIMIVKLFIVFRGRL